MDNQKDFYIKSKLKQDDLISKKADDVFNNFLKGEIEMEEEKININDNVVNINSAKDKKIRMKKVMSIVATLVVVFLGANVYAATQGYNNIFFIIKNLVSSEVVTDRNEILSDKDITISYQPIEVAKNLNIQINKLMVKENRATLIIKIDEEYPLEYYPAEYYVYDVTEGRKETLGHQANSADRGNNLGISYVEEINLEKLKNDTKTIQLDILDKNKESITVLEIDIENKEIEIINSKNVGLEKISEIELKNVLGSYVHLLSYDLFNAGDYMTREEFKKEALVETAMLKILEKDGYQIRENNSYSIEEVHKAIEELCGNYYQEPINLQYSIILFDTNKNCYSWDNGDGLESGLCLDISDITFQNGIYTVEFVYCLAGDDAYMENYVEDSDKYESLLKLSINENYDYFKYKIENFETIRSEYYEDSNNENDSNILNSEEFLQFDSKFYSIDYIAQKYWDTYGGDTEIYYDLDGDGVKDLISIKVEKGINEFESDTYIFSLNGIEFERLGTELYVVDFNKNDNNAEIVIFDPGPSDDPVYSIYSKIDGKMVLQKWMEGSQLKTDEKGTILTNSWYDAITDPAIYFKYYYINNNKIEEKSLDIEKVKDKTFKMNSELMGIYEERKPNYYFTENFEDVSKHQMHENIENLRPLNSDDEFEILSFECVKKVYNEDYTAEIYKIEIKLNNDKVGYLYHIQWAG